MILYVIVGLVAGVIGFYSGIKLAEKSVVFTLEKCVETHSYEEAYELGKILCEITGKDIDEEYERWQNDKT